MQNPNPTSLAQNRPQKHNPDKSPYQTHAKNGDLTQTKPKRPTHHTAHRKSQMSRCVRTAPNTYLKLLN